MLVNVVPLHFVSRWLKHVMCPYVAFSLIVPLAGHCKQMAAVLCNAFYALVVCMQISEEEEADAPETYQKPKARRGIIIDDDDDE